MCAMLRYALVYFILWVKRGLHSWVIVRFTTIIVRNRTLPSGVIPADLILSRKIDFFSMILGCHLFFCTFVE